MCWPDGICAAKPAGQCMGEQIDRYCDMEAHRMASMEPATKQAKRHGAADAVGNARAADASWRVALRDDTQQSVERVSALNC